MALAMMLSEKLPLRRRMWKLAPALSLEAVMNQMPALKLMVVAPMPALKLKVTPILMSTATPALQAGRG